MNLKDYTESLINNIKGEAKNKKSKAFRKMNMYAATGIITGVFGIIAIATAFPMGLAGLGTAIAALSGYKCAEKKQKMEQDGFRKEIDHLEKIKRDGLRVDNAANTDRNNRYTNALSNMNGKEEHIKNQDSRDNITCGAAAATGLLGVVFGGLIGIVPPMIAVYKGITDKVSKKDYQDYIDSKVNLDNVVNEYKIIRHARTTRTPVRRTPTRILPSKGKIKSKNYTPEQIAAANKYIDALSNINNSKEKPKQIVKK